MGERHHLCFINMDKENLRSQIEKFKKFKSRNWQPRTKAINEYYFSKLLNFLKDKPFDYDTTLDFFNYMSEIKLAQSVRKQAETCVKAFVRWLFDEGIIEKNWAARIERTRVERMPRILPGQAEVIELIKRATEAGKFDNFLTRFSKNEHLWCLLFIVTCSGTRNFETRQIKLVDVSVSSKQILVREGKTGARTVSVPPIPWLIEELEKRVKGRTPEEMRVLNDRQHYKQDYSDLLFVCNEKRLEHIMRDVGKLWGKGPLNVHDLRRICLRDLKSNGAGIDDIKNVAGHRDIATTLRYLSYDTDGQQRTLKNYSTEARRFRSPAEKAGELVSEAWKVGKVIDESFQGEILTIKVRIS